MSIPWDPHPEEGDESDYSPLTVDSPTLGIMDLPEYSFDYTEKKKKEKRKRREQDVVVKTLPVHNKTKKRTTLDNWGLKNKPTTKSKKSTKKSSIETKKNVDNSMKISDKKTPFATAMATRGTIGPGISESSYEDWTEASSLPSPSSSSATKIEETKRSSRKVPRPLPTPTSSLIEDEISTNVPTKPKTKTSTIKPEPKKTSKSKVESPLPKKIKKKKPVVAKSQTRVPPKSRLRSANTIDDAFFFSKRASPRLILNNLCSSQLTKLSVNQSYDLSSRPSQNRDIYDSATLKEDEFWKKEEIAFIQMRRYHLLTDKLRLVDEFYRSKRHDYTSLVLLLEYIKSSLEENMFFKLLQKQPNILRLYRRYLERMEDYAFLIKLYKYLNMQEELLMTRIRLALKQHDTHREEQTNQRYKYDIHFFTKCTKHARKLMKENPSLKKPIDVVTQHCILLDRERQIDVFDHGIATQKNEGLYKDFPRRCIYGFSASNFIRYLIFYHFKAGSTKVSNPFKNVEKFGLSLTRYKYLMIDARAEYGDWATVKRQLDVDDRGRMKKKQKVSIDTFLEVIHRYNPPENVVRYFLGFIVDPNRLFDLSVRYGSYQFAIKAAVKMASKDRLRQLRTKVDRYGGRRKKKLLEQIDYYLKKELEPPKKGVIKGIFGIFGKNKK